MGQTALSCVRPAATPQIAASSPDHLFKASLKTRRGRSTFIPSSTRLMKRSSSRSTDQSAIPQSTNRSIKYAPRTPANKAAMRSNNESNNEAINEKDDILEMNGLIVRERPSTDNLSITTSNNVDDDEAFCTSTRVTIIPNTTLQFTKVSPLTSENVSPRTVLAFLMTSNHSKESSVDLTNSETLDKILRENQIVPSIDHSTSQEHDSDCETDDEEYYDYEEGYYPYYQTTRRHYETEKTLDVVPTYRYQPREQLVYRRNSC